MIVRLTLSGILLYCVAIIVAVLVGYQLPTRQMVYAASANDSSDIFVLDVNLRLAHNLTRFEGTDRRPIWSPSGQQIVFESWREGVRGVYVMNADGDYLHRLTADPEASEYDPQWTAAGDGIVFRSYLRGSNETHIYRIRPDGTGLQALSAEAVFQPTPASRSLTTQFVDGSWGTYVIDGDESHQLIAEPLEWQETPQWSTDASLIAFLSAGAATDVYVLTADDAQVEQVTNDGGPKSNLSWRP